MLQASLNIRVLLPKTPGPEHGQPLGRLPGNRQVSQQRAGLLRLDLLVRPEAKLRSRLSFEGKEQGCRRQMVSDVAGALE